MSVYAILPFISALFVLGLGIIVFQKNKQSRLNQIFFLFTLCVTIWLFSTFMMFTTIEDAWAIFWDRIVYVGVIFIPTTIYHFSLVFTKTKTQKKLLYLGYGLSFIFLFLSWTNYFVEGLYKYNWGYHTQARFFHHIFLAFFTFYIVLFFYNVYQYHRSARGIERTQAKYVFLALFILALGSIAFLPAYGISVFPFAYLSGLICTIILAYAILKHHLMGIRVILTEFLVAVIAFVLLIQFLLSESLFDFIWKGALFFAFLFFGYLLIRSVLREIQRRTELQRLYKEVDRLSKAKSEFISIASHQLRTPLTAIKGYISMIIEGTYGKLSSALVKPLENVYESNEKLIGLVNDLLDLSRLEAGKIELEPTLTSLEKMVSDIIEELKINADKKGLYIKLIKPKEPLPEIMADQPKLRQVVLNIIDNAIKYTNRGGITVEIRILNTKYQICITDTGAGIAEEEMKSLFQMFSRAAAGTKLHTGGAGVGLHVAKKFIEMHHGRIWVESEGKNKGSTFYIELPIK